jgi:uncharacterized protein
MAISEPHTFLKPGRKIKLAGRTYEVVGRIGQGGSGEVYRVRENDRLLALKLFFPFYQMRLGTASTEIGKNILDSLALQRQEYEFLSHLSHPNIVRVYDAGEVRLSATEQKLMPIKDIQELPILITDLVEGKNLRDAITDFRLTAQAVKHIMVRLTYAMQYLHAERRYMHVDIKAENILIRESDHEPILIDFALAKNLNFDEVSRTGVTRLLGDWDLFPKDLPTDHRLRQIKETSATREEVFEAAFPALDFFQFGKMLQKLRPLLSRILTAVDSDYIQLLSDRLLDWDVVSRWSPRDLVPHVNRIGPEPFSMIAVPELGSPASAPRTIVLPTGASVPITATVKQIIDGPAFRRLTQINQLSLLGYVYPGADYKRSVHVLYSYHIGRALVQHLAQRPLFKLLFDEEAVRQLLLISLLHDINHFPFLHIFQESQIPGLGRLEVVDLFCSGEITGESAQQAPSVYDLLADVGVSPDRFKRLVFGKHHEQEGEDLELDQALSSILNSGVDVDKLSYLVLDAHFTGVSYGRAIDLPTIFQAATLRTLEPDGRVHLAFTERAIQALENAVMTRFWNFRSIYWHHTNRALMAMVLDVVRHLYTELGRNVQDYLIETLWSSDVGALRYLDDRYHALTKRPSIVHGLIEDRNRLYKRLYTVRAGMDDPVDDSLYAEFRNLDYDQELVFRDNLATGLAAYLSRGADKVIIAREEILVDIPRREMDTGGAVYLDLPGAPAKPLNSLSDPIRAIDANYEQLAKRIRVFVSPRLGKSVGSVRRVEERKAVQTIVKNAMDETAGRSQVA